MANWDSLLERWSTAGLVDAATAARIREFEAGRASPAGARWPVIAATAFGAVMVGAGVLLFVASHWNGWSPAVRFGVVVTLVSAFHLAGAAFSARHQMLSRALHGIGTAALGAGVSLSLEIFHLQQHWAGGILVWAIGATAAWWVLRDWIQAAFAAVLFPWGIVSEWQVRVVDVHHQGLTIGVALLVLTALVYIGAVGRGANSNMRRALGAIGVLAFIPLVTFLTIIGMQESQLVWQRQPVLPLRFSLQALGWSVALGVPLVAAWVLRRRDAIAAALGAVWVAGLSWIAMNGKPHNNPAFYLWGMAGAIAMVAWGVREFRKVRINLGIAMFALVVLTFYSSSVLDQIGRSAALIIMGFVFLTVGWFLERTRRRLIARIDGGGASTGAS